VDQRFEGEAQQHGGEQRDEDGGGEVQEREEAEDRDDGRTRPDEVQVWRAPAVLLRGVRRFLPLLRDLHRFGGQVRRLRLST
jgi:hypothetical protein